MVAVNLDSGTFLIEGTITWTYDKDCAANHYELVVSGPVATRTKGACTQPAAPPDPIEPPQTANGQLISHLAQEACTFFCGGTLTSSGPVTQTVIIKTGSGANQCWWEFTWSYTWQPKVDMASVEPKTCWTSEETGGTVDVGFDGFVSSESYLKNGSKTKYSFTLTEPDPLGGAPLSRVQGVSAQLQKFDDDNSAWLDQGSAILLGTLPVTATTTDYTYYGNAGVFGNSMVYSALHAPAPGSGIDYASVSDILSADNFANNNNDLASGNVHQADYAGDFPGLTEAGSYRIVVSGTIKGNSGSANVGFSVSSSIIVIGGCNCGE
jgi:hypothetical protein